MEGFADYFARSVEHFLPAGTLAGSGSPGVGTLESPNCAGAGLPGWATNDTVELSVAAVLWDLFDAPGDPGTVTETFDVYPIRNTQWGLSHAIFMIFDKELDALGRWPTIYDFHDAFINRWSWEHEDLDRLLCGNGIPLGHPCPTTSTTTTTIFITVTFPTTTIIFPSTTRPTTTTTTTSTTTTTLPPSLPKICRTCPLAFSVKQGRILCKSFPIRSCVLGQVLNWTVSEGCDWLTLSPTSGTSTGERDSVRACVNTAGLVKGNYECTVTITGEGASNTPRTCVIRLKVK